MTFLIAIFRYNYESFDLKKIMYFAAAITIPRSKKRICHFHHFGEQAYLRSNSTNLSNNSSHNRRLFFMTDSKKDEMVSFHERVQKE